MAQKRGSRNSCKYAQDAPLMAKLRAELGEKIFQLAEEFFPGRMHLPRKRNTGCFHLRSMVESELHCRYTASYLISMSCVPRWEPFGEPIPSRPAEGRKKHPHDIIRTGKRTDAFWEAVAYLIATFCKEHGVLLVSMESHGCDQNLFLQKLLGEQHVVFGKWKGIGDGTKTGDIVLPPELVPKKEPEVIEDAHRLGQRLKSFCYTRQSSHRWSLRKQHEFAPLFERIRAWKGRVIIWDDSIMTGFSSFLMLNLLVQNDIDPDRVEIGALIGEFQKRSPKKTLRVV